jgi:phosphohistidine phosphatase
VNIHFLRHAKTNQVSPTGRDFDRELLQQGEEQLRSFQEFAGLNQLSLAHIYCSTAMRTRQSYAHIAGLFPNASISFHDELYLASATDLLQFINEKKSDQDFLLIGHNDGLSELVSYLSDKNVQLKTCGYVQLSFPFEHSGFLSKGTGGITRVFRVNQ